MAGFWRMREDGIDVFVRLTPRASSDAVGDVERTADGRSHITARVRAVPEKGEANAALEKLIASFMGVSRSSVSVASGGTSRLKTVRIAGDPRELEARVEKFAPPR
jgi:uncharacterized protein YggU (UPF0235/DUF167 family)